MRVKPPTPKEKSLCVNWLSFRVKIFSGEFFVRTSFAPKLKIRTREYIRHNLLDNQIYTLFLKNFFADFFASTTDNSEKTLKAAEKF